MINRIKRLNIPLVIGVIIVSIVLFIAIYGYQLIPLDPFSTHFGLPKVTDGNLTIDNPPHDPNEINIWGTDVIGRDVYSRVIYGAKLTIQLGLIVALFRFLVALPFSFFAGFRGKTSSKIIDIFNTSFSAIPALVVSFIFLNLEFVRIMEIESAFIVYVIVLTFVGWGRLATILRDRIKDILSKDFIKGEIAIGKNKFLIAIQNVLPHLFATMIIHYFIEISRVLIMLAELGVLGVYIGVNKINPELIRKLKIDVMPSYYPEWGSMLGSARYAITAWKPWIAMYPALAILFSVLGFNLLGEGLKIELNKRNSKFITFLKHIPYHLSPRTYVYQIKNIKKNKKTIFLKTVIILGIVIYIVFPSPKSHFQVNENNIYEHLEELSKDTYQDRQVSTNGRDEVTEYIVSKLEASDVDPLFEESFINEADVEMNSRNIQKLDFYVADKKRNINYEYKRDFALMEVFLDKETDYLYSGKLSRKLLTMKSYENGEYDKDEDYLLILDDEDSYDYVLYEKILKHEFIDGIITTQRKAWIEHPSGIDIMGSIDQIEEMKERYRLTNVAVTKDVAEELRQNEGKEIVLEAIIEEVTNKNIKNIGGVIRGRDSSKPPMIISCNYDYKVKVNGIDDRGLLYNGSSIAANLEIARTLNENNFTPDRDIYFIFFDGSLLTQKKGADVFRRTDVYDNLSEDHFIMFLNYLGYKNSDTLFLDTSLLYSDNKPHYKFSKILTKRGKELDMDLRLDKVARPEDGITGMHSNGSSGISIGAVNDISREKADTLEQNINIIDKEKLSRQTQLIIDAITMYDYELK